MNRLAKLALFSSALVCSQLASTAAMAQTAPDGVLVGTVIATKGITLNCVLTLDLDSSNNEGTIAMDPGDDNCAALNFNNQPYDTTYTPNTGSNPTTGTLTFLDVDVTTITLGDCAGDISGTWDGATLVIDDILPAKTAGPDCVVDGAAS